MGLDIEKWESPYFDNKTSAYCLASADKLPFKLESFDFVTSRYTFEHLRSPHDVLDTIAAILKPGGLFVMQTTNKNNPLVIISRMIPFPIKKILFSWFFKDNPSRTFKTCYKINTPNTIKRHTGLLVLERLIMVEDILCQNRLLRFLSSLLYRLIELFGIDSLKGNMIAVYRREG